MAIWIMKFNGFNYTQWSGEMALLLKRKQVYHVVMGEDELPEDPVKLNETTTEKLTNQAVVQDCVMQLGTVRLTILLYMELRLQASFRMITAVRNHWKILVTAFKCKLKFNIFQIRQKLQGIMIVDCDDVDTYALQINQKVNNCNLCSETSTLVLDATRTLVRITNVEHVCNTGKSTLSPDQ